MTDPGYSAFLTISHTVFILSYSLVCYLFVIYLNEAYMRKKMSRRGLALLGIPLDILGLLLLINLFTGVLFVMDSVTGEYAYGMLWIVIYLVAYFYALVTVMGLWKIERNLAHLQRGQGLKPMP